MLSRTGSVQNILVAIFYEFCKSLIVRVNIVVIVNLVIALWDVFTKFLFSPNIINTVSEIFIYLV